MRRLFVIWCLLLAGIFCISQGERTSANWQSRDSNYNQDIANSATFTGPGDVVAGAKVWYGLRAYSTADRGNRLVNVCNSTGGVDVGCADMLSDATTGKLVPATIFGIPCPGTNCTIAIWYDRSGANSCTGSVPCDMSLATIANRYTLTANCIGSTLPCAVAPGSSGYSNSNFAGVTQTNTWSFVAETTNGGNFQDVIGAGGGTQQAGFGNSTNTILCFAGTVQLITGITDGAFHAVQCILAGASSTGYVDGSATSLSIGAAAGATQVDMSSANNFAGKMTEAGGWAIGFSSGQQSSMNSNQHSFWGF